MTMRFNGKRVFHLAVFLYFLTYASSPPTYTLKPGDGISIGRFLGIPLSAAVDFHTLLHEFIFPKNSLARSVSHGRPDIKIPVRKKRATVPEDGLIKLIAAEDISVPGRDCAVPFYVLASLFQHYFQWTSRDSPPIHSGPSPPYI